MLTRLRALLVAALLLLLAASQAQTQSQGAAAVSSPQQQFGAAIGDDYFLANYTQLERYWQLLAQQSDRMRLVDIGRTEEGRTQWMAIVSAPENLAALDHYRDISRRLAQAEGLTEEDARALAAEGKTVVWIDGGLHANEVLGAQQLIELVYELVSRRDPETMRFLRDVIVLAVHANPDGQELVANWYMREKEPRLRRLEGLPRSYQKYVGHDNNRDFYLVSQAETQNMARVLYREWFPQIVLNHHQAAPSGTVMFAPPFGEPFNYVFDPLVPIGIEFVGAAIHQRMAAEGKAGVTMRSASNYSMWWNGGLRTTAYFHNQIGLLTETIGDPTPMAIPFVPERQLPTADLPFPIAPQTWHFRQSVEYSMTANRAVIDIASRFRETFLFNVYRMGRNAIERGSHDTWTMSPRRLAALRSPEASRRGGTPQDQLRDPRWRDPRGYILPADQPDFLTAVKLVDALLKTGITVHRATAPFTVGTRTYPAGSFVVLTAQAFRPHVLDTFEPQDHPDDIPYPGAAPTPPYDNAGWTLAYQMGVKFDRVLEGFSGPFERVTSARPPAGRVTGADRPAGFLVSHHQNDAFVAVNRLLAAGEDVYWLRDRTAGPPSAGTGWIYIAARPTTRAVLERAAADLGLVFTGVTMPPADDALRLRPVRVGLWDRYGGASTSGWTRWLLERYEFPYELVFAQTLDAGNLASRYDVIILPDEAVPSRSDGAPPIADVPLQYRGTLGVISWERTLPQLRKFVEDGGTLMTIGDAAMLSQRMGLPIGDALVSAAGSGTRPLKPDEFYIPGSVLRVSVDNTTPLGYGFEREVDVFFDTSPAFRLEPGAAATGARRVAWFATPSPLRSGWAWGQQYLDGALAVVDATLGKGHVLIFGPEIAYRAQPHGTFKFLFNGIHYARATPVPAAMMEGTAAGSVSALAGHIARAARMTVLTGAGVSAASGIPMFRGVGGLWRQYRAEDLATPDAFRRDPRLVWEWYESRRAIVAGSQPNDAHRVLADWSRHRRCTVITQNVDDLHLRAGTEGLIRLHGSLWELRCTGSRPAPPGPGGCQERWRDERVPLDLPPQCPRCGALARPGVVWFGEALGEREIAAAVEATRCDLFIAIGTSALVYPAAGLVQEARRAGAVTAEINAEATPASASVDIALTGAAEQILPQLNLFLAR